ncbi:MAG TPA: type II toxin-antitoxin system RelE/ParE family toxin [Candidatus Babeliales bacterium]|nr:type II toxin-antitoxin system RelE/ParE family toxin [Candidatus Babeliales bacterium]
MTHWKIEHWHSENGKDSIEKWLDMLTKTQLKSVAKEISMLGEAGNSLKLPHSKALGLGLFELRERRFGYRIYFAFKDNATIILLAGGNKKSQVNDIKIARNRLQKIKGENHEN